MKILKISLLIIMLFVISCKSQPKDQYEISCSAINGASKYHFFIEKKSANGYHLVEDMDYLQPDVTNFRVAVSQSPSIVQIFDNDGSYYMVGIVAEDTAGFYGPMGTAEFRVGVTPQKPSAITIRKLR